VCEWWQNKLKKLVLVCGVTRQSLKLSETFQVVSEYTSSSMTWLRDEPSENWWAQLLKKEGNKRQFGTRYHVTPKVYEDGEWSSVHKTWQWEAPDIFLATEFTLEWEGSWGHVGVELHGWRKTCKNSLVLPIQTRCVFFSVAQTIITPQLSVLDLKKFWDRRPFEKFHRKRASEDKQAEKIRVGLCG